MSADKQADPIDYILNSELSAVLSKAFAELYRRKPDFPVSFLAHWLKDNCSTEQLKKEKAESVARSVGEHARLEEDKNSKLAQLQKDAQRDKEINKKGEEQFDEKIAATKHLEDLLKRWLPEYIEKKYQLTGSYVGNLTYPRKPLESNNFEPGAELDTESPQFIEYIGTSASHEKIMLMKVLPNDSGITYECFKEPEPEPEEAEGEGGEENAVKEPKKTYLYVPDVTKNEKMFYFKIPKLGSYACFPIKLGSCLNAQAFDKGINDYKEYLHNKQEIEKEHQEKVTEARNEYEEAKKKYEEFEAPEDEPNPDAEAEKSALKEEFAKAEQNLHEVQNNPPVAASPSFNIVERIYVLGCDTLGQDRQLKEEELQGIEAKVHKFISSFQQKERQMLLDDILTYIEQQKRNDSLENQYNQFEKNAVSQSEEATKQKFTKEKELEYETSAMKWKKMFEIFQEPGFEKSMKVYFSYNIPKFKEVVQIALMLLRYDKAEINLPRSNNLNFLKVSDEKFVKEFMGKLGEYDLAPEETGPCEQEYKINKLLQRLEKVDMEQAVKYNVFIWALANHIKGLCWTRIQCRDSKIEAHEDSIKAKDERNAQIERYLEEVEKSLEGHKGSLSEENLEAFNEEQWRANYAAENVKPEPLEEVELKKFEDIE